MQCTVYDGLHMTGLQTLTWICDAGVEMLFNCPFILSDCTPGKTFAAMNNDHLSASYFETGNKELPSLFNIKDETNYTPEDYTESKRWVSPICMLF